MAVTLILLVLLIGSVFSIFRRSVGPHTSSPEAEKVIAQYKQTMESMQQYYRSVGEARRLAFTGESAQAIVLLAEAVDKAHSSGVLPTKSGGIPTEGEMLLLSLYERTEPDSSRSQAFQEYMAKTYPRYDVHYYDWTLRRPATRPSETR